MSRYREGVYVVLDTGAAQGRDLVAIAGAAVRGGATMLQVRDKSPDGRALLELTRAVARAVATAGAADQVTLLVNDDVEAAVTARREGLPVAGVHVGQDDVPVARARALLGDGAVVGLSVSDEHDLAAATGAAVRDPNARPDYLGLSPVRATPTKPDAAPALGEDGTRRLAAATTLPCVGIGGLGAGDCGWMRAAGLAGIAVVSAVLHADDPEAATRRLVSAWQDPEAHP